MNSDKFFNQLGQFKRSSEGKVPPLKASYDLLNEIIELLFPILSRKECNSLDKEFINITKQMEILLQTINFDKTQSKIIANKYIESFESIYALLIKDAMAIYEGDPAAESLEEVIVSYPGFYAICIQRLAHELYRLNVPVLPRLFTEYAHKNTGIDIHPGAKIGESFCIDHGTGIVIGETTEIGNQVKIYQGVTLGALSVSKEKAGKKRHPTIKDNVTIYSGTTILGGNTIIEHDTIIGGNVWLTESVEPYSIVLNKSEVYVKNKNPEYEQIIDFVI